MTRLLSPLRRLSALALVGGTAVAGVLLAVPTVAQAETSSVPLDIQTYVSETPVDPHNNDAANMHISASGGQETAQAYFHMNFAYLPEGASLDALTLTLVPTAPLSAGAPDNNNIDNTSAILEVCLLTQDIPRDLTSSHAPLTHDCGAASKTADWQPNGTLKVDLKPLAARWLSGANHGAVILPLPSPGNTYQVAFDKGKTTSSATYTPASSGSTTTQPAPQPAPAQQPQQVPAPITQPGGFTAIVPGSTPDGSVASPAASPVAPAPVIHHRPAANQPQPSPAASTGVPLWVLALAVAGAGAVGLLAYPVSHALSGSAGGVGPGMMTQLRLHPRLFAVTGVLAAYSLTFGTYSLAHPNNPALGGPGATATESPSPDAGASPSADASAAPGSTPTPGSAGAAAAPAPQSGTTQVINGTSVFIPSNGGPPSANLFSASEDRVGLSPTEIKLCGHAALTYANAFQTTPADFNVFWSNVNDKGGIYGRKVTMDYQNDDYKPDTAVKAAETCKNEGIFMLLGGIGFDQIPAVRLWAEQNRMMYIHHIATAQDANKLKYSFAPLPTVEEAGRMFGDVYLRKFSGKKVGILHRGSTFWDPGWQAFHARLRQAGQEGNIVYEAPVNQNQGSYAKELVAAKGAGAEVMWAWENALDTPEMIKQAKGQQWSPPWMVFPFNLELTTVGADALNPPLVGVAAWPAYTKGQYGGAFASYAADIHEFENEYRQYRPNTDLGGAGGDLLFLNWVAQKALYQQFIDCGRDCTRNKFAGMMLTGYRTTVSPNCPADWSRVSHRGGFALDIFEAAPGPGGNPMWQPLARCVERY